jgi:hypothetical protein
MKKTKMTVLMIVGALLLVVAAGFGFAGDIMFCTLLCVIAFCCLLKVENIRTSRDYNPSKKDDDTS